MRTHAGRFSSRLAFLHVPVDILRDDDGIIDNQAQRNQEGKQRHHVDGISQIVNRYDRHQE